MSQGRCPTCKKAVDSSASVCMHCSSKLSIDKIPNAYRPSANVLNAGCGGIYVLEGILDISGVLLVLLLGQLFGLILFAFGIACGFWRSSIQRKNALEYYYNQTLDKNDSSRLPLEKEIEALKELKHLLDMGVLTEDEFQLKKNNLLEK